LRDICLKILIVYVGGDSALTSSLHGGSASLLVISVKIHLCPPYMCNTLCVCVCACVAGVVPEARVDQQCLSLSKGLQCQGSAGPADQRGGSTWVLRYTGQELHSLLVFVVVFLNFSWVSYLL